MGNGNGNFLMENEGKEHGDGNIHDWAMEALTQEGTYLFHSVEPGRPGQCYFLHEKVRQVEAEQWIDDCFNRILQKYGAVKCKTILGGEGHVRKETQFQTTPKITEYLKGLNLSGKAKIHNNGEYLKAPPPRKSKAPPRIRFGKAKEGGSVGEST